MSLENSRKLINDIAAQNEAGDYIEGLLKDPEMRALAEAAEQQTPSKWDALTRDTHTIPPKLSQEEIER